MTYFYLIITILGFWSLTALLLVVKKYRYGLSVEFGATWYKAFSIFLLAMFLTPGYFVLWILRKNQ